MSPEGSVGFDDRSATAIREHESIARDQPPERIVRSVAHALQGCRRIDIPKSDQTLPGPQFKHRFFPSTHFPVPPDPRFAAHLSFLGNRLPDREERVFEYFFKAARKDADLQFVLGGSGWDEITPVYANVNYLRHVYTSDHNALNSTALVVLNVCRESMARCGFSPPTRVFEAAGAGACLITDAWEGVECFLEPERECLVARGGDEVSEQLRALSRERARTIGQAALERVTAEHTYAQRAAEVEEALSTL